VTVAVGGDCECRESEFEFEFELDQAWGREIEITMVGTVTER
jgi:hypothetical protein